MGELAPVAIFTYNRPLHTKRLIQSLSANKLAKDSKIYIFSDSAKNPSDEEKVDQVRTYLDKIDAFEDLTIIKQDKNLGLAKSVISGVSSILLEHRKIIVIEDDLSLTPNYLTFMNDALTTYQENPKVFSITGFAYPISVPPDYNYDAYFSYRCNSWGWGTWADSWGKADWEMNDYATFRSNKQLCKQFLRGGDDLVGMLDAQMEGRIDSWAIRWCYAHFKNDAYCLYPTESKVINHGFDGSGTHCVADPDRFYNIKTDDNEKLEFNFPANIEIDRRLLKEFQKNHKTPWLNKIKAIIKRVLFINKTKKLNLVSKHQ